MLSMVKYPDGSLSGTKASKVFSLRISVGVD